MCEVRLQSLQESGCFVIRQFNPQQGNFVVTSLAVEGDEAAAIGLIEQPADVSPPELARGIELIDKVATEIEAQGSIASEADDDRLLAARDNQFRPLDERGRFAEQIFAH
jgi:hypothetical protein